jgi:2-polyprenyl-6-methoxyphenol hydroxylase-like FAD-dependent oxidoreductase
MHREDITTKKKMSCNTLGQAEANALEDRNYSVLREFPSYQCSGWFGWRVVRTWGEGQSMRFATVPLSYATVPEIDSNVKFGSRQRLTATLRTSRIRTHEKKNSCVPFRRGMTPLRPLWKPRLRLKFSWNVRLHTSIVSDRSSMCMNSSELHLKAPLSAGPGPAIVFVGDSLMTVDPPSLGTGFTMAMEGAHALVGSLESACASPSGTLAFDPMALRQQLQQRHDQRSGRLVSLLRATELVQTLGQPQASLLGFLADISSTRHAMDTPMQSRHPFSMPYSNLVGKMKESDPLLNVY